MSKYWTKEEREADTAPGVTFNDGRYWSGQLKKALATVDALEEALLESHKDNFTAPDQCDVCALLAALKGEK